MMNKLKLMGASLLLGSALLFTPGCANTTPQVIAYKAEGIVIPSVNAAMQGWRDWVVAGHATQAQVDAVKKAYNTYRSAQIIAKAALERYVADPSVEGEVAASNAAASAAKNALLDLINSYFKL